LGDEQGVGREGCGKAEKLFEEVGDKVVGGIDEGPLPAFAVDTRHIIVEWEVVEDVVAQEVWQLVDGALGEEPKAGLEV
jgi:hypothetical protein